MRHVGAHILSGFPLPSRAAFEAVAVASLLVKQVPSGTFLSVCSKLSTRQHKDTRTDSDNDKDVGPEMAATESATAEAAAKAKVAAVDEAAKISSVSGCQPKVPLTLATPQRSSSGLPIVSRLSQDKFHIPRAVAEDC